MPRRREPEAPISLFSFQDIITCLTGILVVLALLMAMDVVARKAAAESPPEARRRGVETDRKEVLERLETLRPRDADLDARLRDGAAFLGELRTAQLSDLPNRIEESKKRAAEARKVIEEKWKEVREKAAELEAVRKGKGVLDGEAAPLAERRRRLTSELAKMKSGATLFFIPEAGGRKEPILVVCSRAGLSATAAKGKSRASFIDPRDVSVAASIRRFEDWLRNRNPDKEYVLLLVKPSAVGYFSDVANVFDGGRWEFGYEPLEEEREVLLGEEEK